jgi:hypothetical protein
LLEDLFCSFSVIILFAFCFQFPVDKKSALTVLQQQQSQQHQIALKPFPVAPLESTGSSSAHHTLPIKPTMPQASLDEQENLVFPDQFIKGIGIVHAVVDLYVMLVFHM